MSDGAELRRACGFCVSLERLSRGWPAVIPHLKTNLFQDTPMTRSDKISSVSPTIGQFRAHHQLRERPGKLEGCQFDPLQGCGTIQRPASPVQRQGSLRATSACSSRCSVRDAELFAHRNCAYLDVCHHVLKAARRLAGYCSPNGQLCSRCREHQQKSAVSRRACGRSSTTVEFCGWVTLTRRRPAAGYPSDVGSVESHLLKFETRVFLAVK